ncbi:DDB1- and CUL4-associated factor 12-like [Amphibalanus amphitrite]|uniref:DDB1- and CUL4-associated factor 12-like n=1 Tax=Amphibalanus amphitrite TaxID=1232801 RepID=UPI001C901E9B|nr:DDB1- and CUL4-associated factor 12-like [Amphibalanus amphitrite]XP_043206812.1 DDB1- and CUL4-associated factor 12-like [Amphibalanus amphitrite]XP_043206813.1 DDB1- and CUL4-associated factor 12-like [Amphibalanus amphitrite]XP_043206814.1 DDB1- and CUL4-associated factor 12-like [Amphibalanus amphitrite]XP_043217432.1 DDB1- and CUL4-associated factor 12-like [Amphibalanus amphitrite]XP_043217433.1 DDB1- and CUL4-associated factor 12-like [Amphibalanus amphitrite]
MATVRRRPVVGSRPPSAGIRQPFTQPDNVSIIKSDSWGASSKPEEFIYYSDSEDEDQGADTRERYDTTSRSFVDFHMTQQSGLQRLNPCTLVREYATKHLLSYSMMRERLIPMNNYNKVFCSSWLSDNQVVFGTKCNKILVYNLRTRRIDNIPMLRSSTPPSEVTGGVYALSLNPSRTLLATSARHSLDLAVYRLPTLDPVCVGENGHKDWMYDTAWLDDQYVATGGRDTNVSLWRVPDEQPDPDPEAPPSYSRVTAVATKKCKTADKVRSLAYNQRDQSLVALSLNAYVHLFDAGAFKQKLSRKLPHSMDNVCLALGDNCKMYAVGSKSHTTILDSKSLKVLKKITAKYHGCGIRSLSFNGDILTIGTGTAVLMFYDLRAQKYLDSGVSSGRAVVLKAASGWASSPRADEPAFHDAAAGGAHQVDHMPAIYTHCYDASGTRLFTAGGPLSVDVRGCYAGLWM